MFLGQSHVRSEISSNEAPLISIAKFTAGAAVAYMATRQELHGIKLVSGRMEGAHKFVFEQHKDGGVVLPALLLAFGAAEAVQTWGIRWLEFHLHKPVVSHQTWGRCSAQLRRCSYSIKNDESHCFGH